jgi:predicted amidohydrolase
MTQSYCNRAVVAFPFLIPYDHQMLKIAAAQMISENDLETNLKKMRKLFEDAVQQKARLVAFPEMAYFMGPAEAWASVLPRYEEILGRFQEWAKESKCWLLPGSLREPVKESPGKFYNTLPLIDPSGNLVVAYRKIFLFRATLPTRTYDETKHCTAGEAIQVVDVEGVSVGLAICFDLRFPELFRALKRRGAELVILPAAFTATTGKAHWETLTRARAVENQFFFAAPAQVGRTGEGGDTWGHTAIYSPWGDPLAVLGDEEGCAYAEIDLADIDRAKAKVDAWGCRRDSLFSVS